MNVSMPSIDLGETFLLMCLAFAGILGIIVLAFVAGLAVRAPFGGRGRSQASENEARIMQETYIGLEKLNNRVESIETIVLDEREETKTV